MFRVIQWEYYWKVTIINMNESVKTHICKSEDEVREVLDSLCIDNFEKLTIDKITAFPLEDFLNGNC